MSNHLIRVDPNIRREGAIRILSGLERDLPKLRPKARKAAEQKISEIKEEIKLLED